MPGLILGLCEQGVGGGIYFIENKEKTLRASYDRGTQILDYMD